MDPVIVEEVKNGGSDSKLNDNSDNVTSSGRGDKTKELKNGPPIAAGALAGKQTIIRLKRRIEDSPSKVLLVSYKRSKSDLPDEAAGGAEDEPCAGSSIKRGRVGEDEAQRSQVLRLVGTVAEKEIDADKLADTVKSGLLVATSIRNDRKKLTRRSVKATRINGVEKVRENFQRKTEECRFMVISDRRRLKSTSENRTDTSNGWSGDKDLLHLLDLVPESNSGTNANKVRPPGFEVGNVTCNGKPMLKDSDAEAGYVYDLYISNDPTIEEVTSGISVRVAEAEEMDFADRDSDSDNCENVYPDDDDDSNAEDNWRNDYPDSEEEGLVDDSYGAGGNSSFRFQYDDDGGEEMLDNFNRMKVGDSSSDDDDPIYGIEDDGFTDGLYGSKLAKYRAGLRKFNQDYADQVVSSESDDD